MKSPLIIALVLLFSVSLFAGGYRLSPALQQQYLENGEWLMGLREHPSDSLMEVIEDAEDQGLPQVRCGTPVTIEYTEARHQHAASLGKAPEIATRPSGLDSSYVSPAGLFRIHYAPSGSNAPYQPTVTNGNGVPMYIVTMGQICDSVYDNTINGLGYPPAPRDDFYPEGGDSLYDVYIRNLPGNIFGQTWPDNVYFDTDSLESTSFIELDNDYQQISSYASRPLDAVRVTFAHEYFHAVQFGIDYTESNFIPITDSTAFAARYWMEMSAVWMEEQLYDNINDYYSYLPTFFNNPRVSLQAFRSSFDLHPYASVMYPIFLTEYFDADMIRAIWMKCRQYGRGTDFLLANQFVIDSASGVPVYWICNDGSFIDSSCVDSVGYVDSTLGYDRIDTLPTESIASVFREFALWNYFTGFRAEYAPNNIGYSEKHNYPAIPDDAMASHRTYPIILANNDNEFKPQANAATYIRFQETRNIIPRFWDCTNGTFGTTCLDSVEVIDTSLGYERADTSFTVRVFYGFNPNGFPWGLNIVYQLDDDPDSLFVEQYGLPAPTNNNIVSIESLAPNRYRSITYIISHGTDFGLYNPDSTSKLGYIVRENSRIDSTRIYLTANVLFPYPNPAVVSEMEQELITFQFQVPTDSAAQPVVDLPYMLVDIFNIAGEYVASIDRTVDLVDQLGVYEINWDMTNQSGKNVASGAYLALARLYRDATKKELLAEEKVKVAVIR